MKARLARHGSSFLADITNPARPTISITTPKRAGSPAYQEHNEYSFVHKSGLRFQGTHRYRKSQSLEQSVSHDRFLNSHFLGTSGTPPNLKSFPLSAARLRDCSIVYAGFFHAMTLWGRDSLRNGAKPVRKRRKRPKPSQFYVFKLQRRRMDTAARNKCGIQNAGCVIRDQ